MKMRGLPFSAGDKDIEDFLHPLQPTSIEVIYDSYGRHSGEAVVTLDSQQSVDEAVKKDKQYMGNRYIEIYPTNRPPPPRGGRGGYRGY